MMKRLKNLGCCFYVELNPLHWRIHFDRAPWMVQADFGPFSVLVVW